MLEINYAWEIIGNPQSKIKYDDYLTQKAITKDIRNNNSYIVKNKDP